MLNAAVGAQELTRGEHQVAHLAPLRVVVVQSVDVRLDCVPRPEHLVALGAGVVGVQVVALNVVGEVGHRGVAVLADRTHPEHRPGRLVPLLGRHCRDQFVKVWK